MKIATILFTYNRSIHTKKVLDALSRNTVLPERLYIFQDGLKEEAHREEWEKVNACIREVDFCPTELHVAKENRGLAQSVVSGVNKAFGENDAVIVLEDDCVPTCNFISFMRQCFERYEDDKRIYSVSGYAWPIKLAESDSDIYFCGRTSSWGWGTWKDRWKSYTQDYLGVKKLRNNKEGSMQLALWGADLEDILIANVRGICDSWAVFWALTVISHGGYCINPYRSLIRNIGCDGTGVHCGKTDKFDTKPDDLCIENFAFPETTGILEDTREAFASLYGSYTAVAAESAEKEKVIVYGLGNFFRQHEKELNDQYNIAAFIDCNKKGFWAGKRIIKRSEIQEEIFDKVIIMLQSVEESLKVVRQLCDEEGIREESILLGRNICGGGYRFEEEWIDASGSLVCSQGNIRIPVDSVDEYNNVYEVLVNQNYNYLVNNARKDIVFDIGMNIGDSVLYFLNNANVQKVYGFEPFHETFLKAQRNCRDYLKTDERLEVFPFGISSQNAHRVIGFNTGMTCGQSTIAEVRERAYSFYHRCGLADENMEKQEKIEVRKASEVLAPIINSHAGCNIILKMDCEGEEYNIMQELSDAGVLRKMDFVMMEWHYRGKESLLQTLIENGFSYWCSDKSRDMGLIYAYKGK